jgi:hypothetical protein
MWLPHIDSLRSCAVNRIISEAKILLRERAEMCQGILDIVSNSL